MELYKLEKEKRLKEVKKRSIERRLETERNKLDLHGTSYDRIVVDSGLRDDQLIDILSKITDMEEDLVSVEKELDNVKKEIDDYYDVYKGLNDRDTQIYIERKLYRWSVVKIAMRHQISESRVYQILNEFK